MKKIYSIIPILLIAMVAYAANDPTLFTNILVTDAQKIGGSGLANSKAALELNSTTKGFLPSRMTTTQRNAIASPPQALTLFNTTTSLPNYYDGSSWRAFASLDGAESLSNKDLVSPQANKINFTEAAAPGTPAAGTLVIYAKTDNKVYKKTPAGVETEIGGSGGLNNDLSNLTAPTAANADFIFNIGGISKVKTGDKTGGSNSDEIDFVSGDVVDGTSGPVLISSGNATGTGSTQDVVIGSGNAAGAGDSGTIRLLPGTSASGTRGRISFEGDLSQNLSFKTGGTTYVKTFDQLASASSDGIVFQSGQVVDGGSGATIISSGNATGDGNTGDVRLIPGSIAGAGTKGKVSLEGNLSQHIILDTGGETNIKTKDDSVATQSLNLRTGDSTGGETGSIQIFPGLSDAADNGHLWMFTRDVPSSDFASGSIEMFTGGNGSTNAGTGFIHIYTQASGTHGTTGEIHLTTGVPGGDGLRGTFKATDRAGTIGFINTTTPVSLQDALFGIKFDLADGDAARFSANNYAIFSANNSTNDATPTGNIFIETGNKTSGTGNAGTINLISGSATGNNAGSIGLYAGTSVASYDSGAIQISGGNTDAGYATGVTLDGGDTATGSAGWVTLRGGNASNNAGDIGSVRLKGGSKPNGETGKILLDTAVAITPPGSALTVIAGDQINPTASSFIPLTSAGAVTLHATSILAGTRDGQLLKLVNVGSNNIIIQNSATVLNPGGANLTLGANVTVDYVWYNTAWYGK